MRKIKIFPSPHVEVRIYVTDEMEKDFKECKEAAESKDPEKCKDCSECSWFDSSIEHIGMCQFPDIERHLLLNGSNDNE